MVGVIRVKALAQTMDNVDVPIIACNNGLVFRDRDQTTPGKNKEPKQRT